MPLNEPNQSLMNSYTVAHLESEFGQLGSGTETLAGSTPGAKPGQSPCQGPERAKAPEAESFCICIT